MTAFPAAARAQVETAVRVAAASPDDAAATGRLGMVLQAWQQPDLAEQCYNRAHIMDPKSLDWAWYLGTVELLQGETRLAIGTAQEAVSIDSSSKPARRLLADALLAGGKFAESRKIYEALVKEEPDRAAFHYGLGKVLEAQGGSVFQSIEEYKRASQLAPSFGAAHLALSAGYSQIRDAASAARETTLYQANPSGAPPENSLMAQITALNPGGARTRTAQEYLASSKRQEAAKQLETVVAADPNNEAAHTGLVEAYREMNRPDRAEEHYRIAARLNPNTRAHYVFGLLMPDQDRYTEAGAAFQRAIAANPRDAQAKMQLGRVLQLKGDLDGAIRQYGIALGIDPDSRAANYLMGVALLKQNQPGPAIERLLKTVQPVDARTPGYARQLAEAYRESGDAAQATHYDQMAGGRPDATASLPADQTPEWLAGQHDPPALPAAQPVR